jgi:DNA-binding NarL/FixJ family response regulator
VGPDNGNAQGRVLIVDNSADMAEVLGEIIRLDGALSFVGYVLTGAEAVEKARQGVADVFVVDLGLPDCSGFDVLERVRAHSSTAKVIIHTGHASEELAAHAKRKGAAAYVLKDGDCKALLAAIHAALGRLNP